MRKQKSVRNWKDWKEYKEGNMEESNKTRRKEIMKGKIDCMI